MEKTFFKFGLFFALGLTTAMFYSCDDDDDKGGNGENGSSVSKITASNVIDSSSQIAMVKAEIEIGEDYDWEYYTIAEAQYKNKGFTLNLPSTVPAIYLDPLMEDGENVEGITISNKTAKGIGFSVFSAYDKEDEEIGQLAYIGENESKNSITGVIWLYIDKNVTINGKNKEIDEEYDEEYIIQFDNLTLKKGWNLCYLTHKFTYNQSTEKELYTTTWSNKKPSGITLSWYYSDYYVDYSVSMKSSKSNSTGKSLFSKIGKRMFSIDS